MVIFQSIIKSYLLIHSVHSAIVNVALNRPSWQSSTDFQWNASRANDGNTGNTAVMRQNSCSHTKGSNQSIAWWQVDLGEENTISQIILTTRNWEEGPQILAGFSVYVSRMKKETWEDRELCFHDSYPQSQAANGRRMNCTSSITGQYVVVYNKRPVDNAVQGFNYSDSAILELCEVNVPVDIENCEDRECKFCKKGWYGEKCRRSCKNCGGGEGCNENGICIKKACKTGYYGVTCISMCPANCRNKECYFNTGYCRQCEDRYYGSNCSDLCPYRCTSCTSWQTCSSCRSGRYGRDCSFFCFNCGGNGDCDIHGVCLYLSCKTGFYGSYCNQTCSNNCGGDHSCDFATGKCKQCSYGKYGDFCNIYCPAQCHACRNSRDCDTCKTGFYGTACRETCPGCGGDGSCRKSTGICNYALSCKPTYFSHGTENKCDRTCPSNCGGDGSCYRYRGRCRDGCMNGYMGEYCNQFCSSNCGGNGSCDRNSGRCSKGCKIEYMGEYCRELCSPNCADDSCHQNGTCRYGCKSGYMGVYCNQPCPSHCGGDGYCYRYQGGCSNGCKTGYMGEYCNRSCSSNCADDSCHQNGKCRYGCKSGYMGVYCNQSCPSQCGGDGSCVLKRWNQINCSQGCKSGFFGKRCSQSCSSNCAGNRSCHRSKGALNNGDNSSSKNIGVIIGAVGAVLLLALIFVVVIVLTRRVRDHGKEDSLPQNDCYVYSARTDQASHNTMYASVMPMEEDKKASDQKQSSSKPKNRLSILPENAVSLDTTYYNIVQTEKGVKVTDIKAYVTDKILSKAYEEEFKDIPYGAIHPTTVAEIPKNIKKNRYKTTYPYDHSRVILKGKTDYINANFIEDAYGTKRYIATQGPVLSTIEDFWQMVWEYNVDIIVMLTNIQEGKKKKCDQYWPKPNEKMTHGHFGLTLKDKRVFSYYALRELDVLDTKSKQKRNVLQYHFTTWPDHGTPDPLFLVLFHKRVISTAPKYDGPLLVHCSAGIGRTGTFIALDALDNQGKNSGMVDIENYVRIMRKDRMNMIQNSEQYRVLHEALIEAFQWKDTSISMDSFSSLWQSIENDNGPLNQQYLKKEYDILREMKSPFDNEKPETALKEENKSKNRTVNILPLDKHRPFLTSYVDNGGDDYINSVIISSHISKIGFLVTQVPLPGTIVDFWRLIEDHNSHCIVHFASSSDDGTNFYPTNCGSTDTEIHLIKRESSNTLHERVEEIKIKLYNKKNKQTKDAVMLKIDMADKGCPSAAQLFIAVEILELQRKRHKNSPCTVVALDGCTPCEVFCALSNILEYMKVDNRIDVFQTARQLQIRRPEFFGTFETYRYCYQIVNEYLMTQNVYFNG